MVTGFSWKISTGTEPTGGTDARLDCEILRDGAHLFTVHLELGNSERLDRGRSDNLFYMFKRAFYASPIDEGLARGTVGIEVPHGIPGHVTLRLRILGDDLWVKKSVTVSARLGTLFRYSEGGGLLVVPEDEPWEFLGFFGQQVTLSTDSREGFTTWDLRL